MWFILNVIINFFIFASNGLGETSLMCDLGLFVQSCFHEHLLYGLIWLLHCSIGSTTVGVRLTMPCSISCPFEIIRSFLLTELKIESGTLCFRRLCSCHFKIDHFLCITRCLRLSRATFLSLFDSIFIVLFRCLFLSFSVHWGLRS